MADIKKDTILRYFVWLLFLLGLIYVKLAFHELWKDEWQAWFVAKDKSLSEIVSFLYYEGHPALWYLYLKLFTYFTSLFKAENIIQMAHFIIVAVGMFFLFVKFRLPLIVKIMFALSYFIFFEYGLINRGYGLVILFVFWAAFLLKKENYSRIELGIVLMLLCQTEVYGVLMALALGFYIIIRDKTPYISIRQNDILGLTVGLILFVLSVFPRSIDHINKTKSKDLNFVDNMLTSIQGNLSNTYFIGSTDDTFTYGWSINGLIFSALCFVGLWLMFHKQRKILYTFLIFLLMMIVFSVSIFLGGIRQWGMGLVFMIALLEIRGLDIKKEKLTFAFICVASVFNIIHCFKALGEEIRLPFTNAREAGLFIKGKVPSKVPVVAINKFEATPVIGYAERQFYELPDGVEFSYFRWVDKIYLPVQNELKLFGKYKGVGGIVVVSPKPLDKGRFPALQLWKKFDARNYKNENYYIYTFQFSGLQQQE